MGPSGSRFCATNWDGRLSRLCEDSPADVGFFREETGLARSEVILQEPPEAVVEARGTQVRPRRAEVISPDRERLGIILPENALADDGHAEFLAERFEDLRRGQHAARKHVALDEVDLAA